MQLLIFPGIAEGEDLHGPACDLIQEQLDMSEPAETPPVFSGKVDLSHSDFESYIETFTLDYLEL